MPQSRSSIPLRQIPYRPPRQRHTMQPLLLCPLFVRNLDEALPTRGQQHPNQFKGPMQMERNGFACSDHHPCGEITCGSILTQESLQGHPKPVYGMCKLTDHSLHLVFSYHLSQHLSSPTDFITALSHAEPQQHQHQPGSPKTG